VQRPHEDDAHEEGTWRDRERTRWERMSTLRS
jgi:hypothetical protein